MTRKQLITACVENQIERGIVKKENKEMQINIRLNGGHSGQKPMLKAECQRWYDDLFKTEERKEEKKMTKKQIITKCVEEKIKRGSIKKENRKKEIDARLNGIGNWLKPMNKNQYTSWYDDLFKPEYQIIK